METLVLSYAKKWMDTLNLCVQSPAEKSLQSGRTTLKKSIKPMVHPNYKKYCNSPPTHIAHANFVTSPTQISHFFCVSFSFSFSVCQSFIFDSMTSLTLFSTLDQSALVI